MKNKSVSTCLLNTPSKKRGRPKGSKNKVSSTRAPNSSTPKKRGRPKGSKNKIKNKVITTSRKQVSSPLPESFIQRNQIESPLQRSSSIQEPNTYTPTVGPLKFQLSKQKFPYLDFENIRIIPFNVAFDPSRMFNYLYIHFTHSSLKKEFTTASIMTMFGTAFIIPTVYARHLTKKEKLFLSLVRNWVITISLISCKDLLETELSWPTT